MLQSTKGIVFQYLNYSESSVIVKIFTEVFGLQSYIVKGIRSKKSKTKLALFQPLTLLDLVVYHKEGKQLHHLKEVQVAFAYQSIPLNMTKRLLLFFIDELLVKSVREEMANKPLFDWLFNSLRWLDLSNNNMVNFHLVFMMQLTRFLGFYPKKLVKDSPAFFDLQEGQFVAHAPQHSFFTDGKIAQQIGAIYKTTFEDSGDLLISNSERRKLIDTLIKYYSLHLPAFGGLKSVEVLKTVF